MSSRAPDPLVAAFRRPLPCACDCHASLSLEERTQGVAAMYRFDDAMVGWGYQPIYELGADRLFRAARAKNERGYRGIAVRDEACLYRRFVGFAVHELIHALAGDVAQPNYGIPFGAPYGVPASLPPSDEKSYLDAFNRGEARAWVGLAPMARALYGIEWTLRAARDVGTYGFPGGNALVDVPEGFRAVPHFDRVHHPERYYALAHKIEVEERGWFSDEKIAELVARVEAAEAIGRERKLHRPPPGELAALPPGELGRNDPCACGSGKKAKLCCLR